MAKLADDILEGLQDALAYAKAEPNGARVTTLHVPDVRAIREGLHMSQAEFSEAYQIPLATLQGWEQGRRNPDKTASAYLSVIARLPVEIRSALHA